MITHSCSVDIPHDPHFWISAIASGQPGPVVQLTLACPGVEAKP